MAEGEHISLVPGLSRFTECAVCMLKINNHRCLPCMHAFCHDCLVPFVEEDTIACPTCGENCNLKVGGVTELPKSPSLVEVLAQTFDLRHFTNCSVCLGKIKNHRCLPCMHVFCHDCLVTLEQRRRIACPLCREPCILKAGGVTELPKDPLLLEVLGPVCEECLERGKEVHCDHCDKELCTPCRELCKLSVELEEMTAARDKKIEEIRRVKKQWSARKEEHIAKLNRTVQQAIHAISTKQSKIVEHIEKELDKQSAPVNDWCDDISEECKQIQSFIDKADEERANLTVARVKSIGEDCRQSITDTSMQGSMPPDEARYEGHLEEMEVVTQAINKLGLTEREMILPKSVKPEILVTTQGYGNGQFECPTHVAVSPITRNLVVTDKGNSRIQIFNSEHQYLTKFGSMGTAPGRFNFGNYFNTGGVAITSNDHIIVTDSVNHRIQMFTERGVPLRSFGSHGDAPGEFNGPTGVFVHRNKIHICDSENYRIQVLNEDGTVVRIFGSAEIFAGFKPESIVVCDNGDAVVGTIDDHTSGQLIVFTKHGQYKTSLCTGEPDSVKVDRPLGLSLDGAGNIVVTDRINDNVHVITPTGQLIHSFGSPGDVAGQFDHPVGVVCLEDGRIVVADYGNHRVQVINVE